MHSTGLCMVVPLALVTAHAQHGFICCCLPQGAAEIVLARCVALLGERGEEEPMRAEVRSALEARITGMAASGLRTLCLAQRRLGRTRSDHAPGFFNTPPDEQLTLCCIVGIKARRLHAAQDISPYKPCNCIFCSASYLLSLLPLEHATACFESSSLDLA